MIQSFSLVKVILDMTDHTQSFLIFQLVFKTFLMSAGLTNTVVEWESKGLSNEKIRPTTANNSLFPKLRSTNNSKIRVEFNGC